MTKLIIFRDLNRENLHGYSFDILPPGTLILKENVLFGMAGYPPLYIRRTPILIDGEPFLVLSQTDYEITESRRENIVHGAIEFMRNLN